MLPEHPIFDLNSNVIFHMAVWPLLYIMINYEREGVILFSVFIALGVSLSGKEQAKLFYESFHF